MTNKSRGQNFEAKVYDFLEKEGFIVNRCTLDVDLKNGKIIKMKYSPFNRYTGHPDFIAWMPGKPPIGVECKGGTKNNYLTSDEKDKFEWLLRHEIFVKIYVARKERNGKTISIKMEEYPNPLVAGKKESSR